jgi:putative peptidoglycan lipid II flippase
VAVNLVGNLALILPLEHMGPPLATAIASTVNVWMLYRTLVKRGHFQVDTRLRRRAPRLALAALAMGAVLWAGQGLIMPYVHGTWLVRFAAMAVLVSSGVVVYGLATVLLGAFSKDDLRLLLRRRRTTT